MDFENVKPETWDAFGKYLMKHPKIMKRIPTFAAVIEKDPKLKKHLEIVEKEREWEEEMVISAHKKGIDTKTIASILDLKFHEVEIILARC